MAVNPSLRLRMRRIAEPQWGVISQRQLHALGLNGPQIRGMRRRGELIEVFRGVYALGHGRLGTLGLLHAALLAAGPGAFLSHRSAGGHRDLCRHPPEVVVTVPQDHTPARIPGLHIRRTTTPVDRTQVRPVQGLPTATVPRIIVDLAAAGERAGAIDRLIVRSIRAGQFDLAAVTAAIDNHPRRPGTGLARAALRRYLPGSGDRRSWLEEQFQAYERADRRLPTPLYNRYLGGYEIDVMWPAQRVALELDGRPYHVAVRDFDRDRVKDRRLQTLGWRPVRVSDFEWEHDRRSVLADLYSLLGV